MLIHWKKRDEKKLTLPECSVLAIFLYLLFAMPFIRDLGKKISFYYGCKKKNKRTLKFKGQLTFVFFAAVDALSGPRRKHKF